MLDHAFPSPTFRNAIVGGRRRASVQYLLVAVTGAALLLAAVPAHAQDAHGAIAFGETAYGEFVTIGFSWNRGTRGEAKEAALSECRAGGGTNCVELAWFRNGCGALAVGQYGVAQGKSAISQERAEARALQGCKNAGGSGCSVVVSQCARPGGQAGGWSGSERVLARPEEKPEERAGAERPVQAGAGTEAALTECLDLTGASYHCQAPKADMHDIEVSFAQGAGQVTVHSRIQGRERSTTNIVDGKFRHVDQDVYQALHCDPRRLRRVTARGHPSPNRPRNGLVMDYRLDKAGNLIFTVNKGRLPRDDIESVIVGENLTTRTCQRK